MCPVCKSLEPCLIPPSETRRIVLADSTIPKNTLHFEIDCIVGGRVQDLTTALIKKYLHMPTKAYQKMIFFLNNSLTLK